MAAETWEEGLLVAHWCGEDRAGSLVAWRGQDDGSDVNAEPESAAPRVYRGRFMPFEVFLDAFVWFVAWFVA